MNMIEQLEASGEVLSPSVRAVLAALHGRIEELQKSKDELERTVAALEEQVQELKAQLAQNSTNSSKPPSSDPPGMVRPGKKAKGRNRGGQPGHRGHHRQMLPPERVDEVVRHRPAECAHCKASLAEGEAEGGQAHQTVELPPIRVWVTEHRMESVRCPQCGEVTRAELPREVGGKHFGPRLSALGGLLAGYYRMSRRSVVDLLGKLLDVPPPSLGSTEAFTTEASEALEASYREVAAEVRGGEWAGVDETPWKLRGKKQWLWVAVGKRATMYHLGASRGAEELRRFLGDFSGIVSSDRWCAYQIYKNRQLCLAHLMRNFKKLKLRGGKAAEFAAQGEKLCERVFERWRRFREGGLDRAALKSEMQSIQASFRRLIKRGAESINRKVASMCRNLLKLWRFLWTFLDEAVEITNNVAERALRKAVLWRKNCFGNQSEAGMRYAERILTIGATCQQQGIHPLDFLALSIAALRAGSPAPKILPGG